MFNVVETINNVFKKEHLIMKNINTDEIINILKNLNIKSLLGIGAQTICFDSDEDYVYKCCYKEEGTLINDNFSIDNIKNIDYVLLPENIINCKSWIIYKQRKCTPLDYCSLVSLNKILFDLKDMYSNDKIFPDLYFKNYGTIDNNTERNFYIYDFHNIDKYKNCSYFLCLNVYLNVMNTFKIHLKKRRIFTEDVIEDNFGKDKIHKVFYNLIKNIYNKENILNDLDNCLAMLTNEINNTFQKISLTDNLINKVCNLHYINNYKEHDFDLIIKHLYEKFKFKYIYMTISNNLTLNYLLFNNKNITFITNNKILIENNHHNNVLSNRHISNLKDKILFISDQKGDYKFNLITKTNDYKFGKEINTISFTFDTKKYVFYF